MDSIKFLYEKKGKIIHQMSDTAHDARNQKRLLTKDEEVKFEAWNKELDELEKNIRIHENEENVKAQLSEPVNEKVSTLYTKADLKEKANEQFKKWMIGGVAAMDPYFAKEMRAQTTTDTAGGHSISPGEMVDFIETALLAFGGVYANSTVLKTATGAPLEFPTVDDTSNVGDLESEGVTMADSVTDLTFGSTSLNAYKYSSELLQVSNELIQDSEFDILSYVTGRLAERIWRVLNQAFTYGTDSSQPQGCTVGAATGDNGPARVTELVRNDILTLIHSVDPLYRVGSKVRLAFNDTTLLAIKKLAVGSADARPLWQPSMASGEPNTIEGYKYFVNQDMNDFMPTYKPMIFGDFSKFYIREVKPIKVVKLVERYAELDNVGIVALGRWDSVLINAGTNPLKVTKCATT